MLDFGEAKSWKMRVVHRAGQDAVYKDEAGYHAAQPRYHQVSAGVVMRDFMWLFSSYVWPAISGTCKAAHVGLKSACTSSSTERDRQAILNAHQS